MEELVLTDFGSEPALWGRFKVTPGDVRPSSLPLMRDQINKPGLPPPAAPTARLPQPYLREYQVYKNSSSLLFI